MPAASQSLASTASHNHEWPPLLVEDDPAKMDAALALGPQLERGRSARQLLEDRRRRERALDALTPQRAGVVDAYVVSVALDSDPVFAREAREAGKVLSRRYGAAGHTIVLAGDTGRGAPPLPQGNPESLTLAIARAAELMDREHDVLVLYVTTHGAPVALAYHDGDEGYGLVSPARLAAIFDELGIRNRLLILSACYSGIFVPSLADAHSVVVTAAASDRTSFGCSAENDWTFFGDALVNHALRKPQPLEAAVREARGLIDDWERSNGLTPSNPQIAMGADVSAWLAPLEASMPKVASPPAGAPATDALKD
ncbi:C13 family peptidase [Sphingomonas sp.]|uniref:C13 family peptidase n=1 Tax=Sphingomonas sp. TaxID=28214 RepID=UPI0025FFAC06|nr:C13 family peptidase [Sphingomonas sp.]